MYLTEIDTNTGLILHENSSDGVYAIKEFREVIDDPTLGVPCMTAIALTADYLSPIRYYVEEDRPRKAMEEVTGNRDAFVWKQEKIQNALIKYDELQYNPLIEEGRIHYERKVSKLKEFKEANEKFNLLDSNGKKLYSSIRDPDDISVELRRINEDIDRYEKSIAGKELYSNSPVKNGYKLTRLEQLILKKSSFYNKVR